MASDLPAPQAASVRRSFAAGGIVDATVRIVAGALSQEAWIAIACFTLAVSLLSLTTASANAMPIDVAPYHRPPFSRA
jgi:hypothetical protein